MQLCSQIKADVKAQERQNAKDQKLAQRNSKHVKRANPNRQPSGFVKPTRISNELAEFLGLAAGTELARTEVSKKINNYITKNNLQEETNRRKINPDAKLRTLLKLQPEDDALTYFNLQRYLAQHFPKGEATLSSEAAAPSIH